MHFALSLLQLQDGPPIGKVIGIVVGAILLLVFFVVFMRYANLYVR